MKKFFKFIIALCLIVFTLYVSTAVYFHLAYPQTRWDWSKIDMNDTRFPNDFLWGTATAAHQIEGGNENSNWGEWETDSSRIKDGSNARTAVDGWRRYKDDIKLMKDLGVNSYRFSLAWNKIEPYQGKPDESALQHYDDLINELKANRIEPMITLHHFTHPQWFEQLGAFEREENIKYFVEFSKLVFNRYKDRVKFWVTLNEPNVFITNGYFNTTFPPGKSAPALAAEVLKNMLKSHVEIYRAFKSESPAVTGGFNKDQIQIGVATSVFQFEPARRWHLGDWAIARISSNSFNESVLGFFRTGDMNFYVPLETNLTYTDSNAPHTLDFIGVNYYSHYAFKFDLDFKKATQGLPVEGEEMTDMPYTIYTEGIYRAVRDVSNLKKPIIITENGISDAADDRREKYIRQSLYAVSKAIKDGYDIRGYYYWTLLDNFEWAEGYTQKFGLYEVNLNTQERRLRNGSKAFAEIISKSR